MGIAPPRAHAQASETVLHSFSGVLLNGANPYAGVIRDSAGNLYGTTFGGGIANAGVVYKLDTSGHETVLYRFTGGADGANPYAGVIGDSAGNLYGTTRFGGTAGCGTVYKLDATRHETVLYSFTCGADGADPSGVNRDSAGNLYGTTGAGGLADCEGSGCGVVYKLDATGHQTVLYSFTGGANGAGPSGVIRDSAGNLYGTAGGGDSSHCLHGYPGCGVVFKLDTAGNYKVLYAFTGGADGAYPSGVIRDLTGNLYGATSGGGTVNAYCGTVNSAYPYGCGVVYKLDATGHETVLHSFTGGYDVQPNGGVIRDPAGNLYGTTYAGGVGEVYMLDASGNETVLYTFNEAGGLGPYAGVIRDSAGNLYGTTSCGGGGTAAPPLCPGSGKGPGGAGAVFKLDASGHETVLYSFTTGADGANPYSGVIRDPAGNLYGTTYYGGGTPNVGVVYKLEASGHQTVLYSFTGGAADGANPAAGVIRDSVGNLYGTTYYGGAVNGGVLYKLDTTGHETALYGFGALENYGAYPADVIRDSAGNLYGTTQLADTDMRDGACCGVVYKLDATGKYAVLYSFTGGADGAHPNGGLIGDSAGNLYGTTSGGGTAGYGVVYKLDSTGHEAVLYSFKGGADGAFPNAGVIRDSTGNLYGTTSSGGPGGADVGNGVVYKLDTAGHETLLYTFTGGADGANPSAGVIRDSTGNLYGTTQYGGTLPGNRGYGVVYKLDATGHETVLYTFTGGADGANPYAGVIRDAAGNLYGTTYAGGKWNAGVVFELSGAATAQ